MIILDTETTGFIKNLSLPLDQQPDVIELGAVKLDDATLAETAHLHFLIRPRILPLAPETTKANGITTVMVEKELTFARRLPSLLAFFLGESQMVAHNAPFDVGMLILELRRLDYLTKFPWPSIQTDMPTLASDIEGAGHTGRHRQTALYEILYGKPPENAHRALSDARTLADIVRALRRRDGRI